MSKYFQLLNPCVYRSAIFCICLFAVASTIAFFAQTYLTTKLQSTKPATKHLHWSENPNASQAEMNEGAARDYEAANTELNKVYKQILRKHKGETVFLQKLEKAQRAWIVFRDAHMASRFAMDGDPRVNYGSIYPMEYAMEMTVLTKDRTKQLRELLKDAE